MTYFRIVVNFAIYLQEKAGIRKGVWVIVAGYYEFGEKA